MTKAVQTVLGVTGKPDAVAAMLAEIGSLTPDRISQIVGREVTVPEPSFDDDGRWVFPGACEQVPTLAKALSAQFPTLEWFVHVPSTGTGTYDYALTAGTGVMERRQDYSPAEHSALPVGDSVVYRFAIQAQSTVLRAVYVITDGAASDVTDEFFVRRPVQEFPTSRIGLATSRMDYDEDDIDTMLAKAH